MSFTLWTEDGDEQIRFHDYEAIHRHPGLYDDFLVCDFADLDPATMADLEDWSFDCLTTVAALGFGDIPPRAFVNAFNLVADEGWVAFNIRDTFLDQRETTEFTRTVRELVFTDYLEIHHLERYRHRLSIDGEPLHYYAIAGRKTADVPAALVRRDRSDGGRVGLIRPEGHSCGGDPGSSADEQVRDTDRVEHGGVVEPARPRRGRCPRPRSAAGRSRPGTRPGCARRTRSSWRPGVRSRRAPRRAGAPSGRVAAVR